MSARRRVSFQGERGAYSEGAALALFPGAETVPCGSFSEAARAAEAGRSDCAVLPVENSLAGSVGESHAILRDTPLRIVAETYHRIAHCLIGRCAEAEARTVYSHPQALAQCRRYIEARGLRRVPTYDTAGSVAMVAGMGEAGAVCIASAGAARLHGVPVIEEGIADDAENYTRFVVLSSSDPEPAGAPGPRAPPWPGPPAREPGCSARTPPRPPLEPAGPASAKPRAKAHDDEARYHHKAVVREEYRVGLRVERAADRDGRGGLELEGRLARRPVLPLDRRGPLVRGYPRPALRRRQPGLKGLGGDGEGLRRALRRRERVGRDGRAGGILVVYGKLAQAQV